MYDLSKNYTTILSPSDVYEAWISPYSLIPPVYKIEIDPVPGGEYKFYSEYNGAQHCIEGKFVDVRENRKLVYTWNWKGYNDETLVKVSFIEKGNETEIHLSHEFFDTKESRDNHSEGWDHYVNELIRLIKNENS